MNIAQQSQDEEDVLETRTQSNHLRASRRKLLVVKFERSSVKEDSGKVKLFGVAALLTCNRRQPSKQTVVLVIRSRCEIETQGRR